jgi:hypothetical protein
MSERALEKYLVEQARRHAWLCFKWVSPAQRGVPDRILIGPAGKTIFIELKNPNGTGRLSALQQYTIDKLNEHGCDVRVIASRGEIDACFA